jgi:hypothetical protein
MAVAREVGHVGEGSPGSGRAIRDAAWRLLSEPTGSEAGVGTIPRVRHTDDTPGAALAGSGTPPFAAPGLVLLAALAIYEGYHWLNLIPNVPVRPTAVVLALVIVPATYGLTRRVTGPGTPVLRIVARSCADLLPIVWIVSLIVHDTVVSGLLGGISLILAIALVALAAVSEIDEHRRAGLD